MTEGLEKKLHVRVNNGKEKAYLVKCGSDGKAVYFDDVAFLPQIATKCPISAANEYVTGGTVAG